MVRASDYDDSWTSPRIRYFGGVHLRGDSGADQRYAEEITSLQQLGKAMVTPPPEELEDMAGERDVWVSLFRLPSIK